MFKTSNGTAATPTWTRLDDVAGSPLPNRYCTRIAIDPANANQVFVAFGGYSANNLWRTTDGGSTWTAISAGLPEAPIRAIALHPESATHVYIGTEVGVFASENGGTTWSATNEGPTNCSVDELLLMDKKLVAVTHGRGLFAIDLPALTAVSGDRLGYVWANSATAASYTPSSIYAYNSAGGPITITHGAVGVYTVTFSGLGSPRPGGHVQVTAYGATSDTAKVASWSSAGSDFRVNVRCFNHAGSPVDTLYTVLVMWPPTAGPVPDLGEDPMLDTIEPTPGARAIR